MAKDKIYREDVLNLPVKFQVKGEHDMNLVRYVLTEVLNAVKALPSADETPKRTTRKKT